MSYIVAFVIWSIFIASVVVTTLGLAKRSWRHLGVAAILGILFSSAALFSIGPFVMLLVGWQLAAAVAFRWRVGWRGWVTLLVIAAAIWSMAVLSQIVAGATPLLFVLLPLGIGSAGIAMFLAPEPPPIPPPHFPGRKIEL